MSDAAERRAGWWVRTFVVSVAVALVATAVSVAGVVVGNAAHLEVDGGVVQVHLFEAEQLLDVPPDDVPSLQGTATSSSAAEARDEQPPEPPDAAVDELSARPRTDETDVADTDAADTRDTDHTDDRSAPAGSGAADRSSDALADALEDLAWTDTPGPDGSDADPGAAADDHTEGGGT